MTLANLLLLLMRGAAVADEYRILNSTGINLGNYTGPLGLTGSRTNGADHITSVNVNGILNVKTYGAKGDCVSLDDIPIQTALDATPNNGNDGNSPVYMPATPGTSSNTLTKCYLLGRPLLLGAGQSGHGQINFYGDGMEQTYLATNYAGPSLLAGTDHLSYVGSLLTGPGNALDLGASSGFLELSMLLRNRLAGHSAFSIEFELNVPASPSGSVILASQYDYPYQSYVRGGLTQYGAFFINYDTNGGAPRFGFNATLSTSGLVSFNSANNSASTGNHAIGLYYDGAKLWACIDAVATTPVTATGTWKQSLWESITLPDQDQNGPITWPDGSGNFSKDSLNGQIDNIRFSSIARATNGACPAVPTAKFSYDSNTDLLLTFLGCADGSQYCIESTTGFYAVYGQAANVSANQVWFPVLGRGGNITARFDVHDMTICGNLDCQGAYIMQAPWSRWQRLKTVSDHNGFNFWYLDFESTFDNLTALSTVHNGLNAFEWGFSSNTSDIRNLRAEQALVCFNFESAQTDINGLGSHCLANAETAFAGIFSSSTGSWNDFFVDQEVADPNWLANVYVANLGPAMGTLTFLGGNLDTFGGAPFIVHEGDGQGAVNFVGTLFNNFAEDQPAAEVIQFPALLYAGTSGTGITGTVWQGQPTAAANATIANAPIATANWAASTAYALNAVIKPTSGNAGNYQFQATVAGTSGATAPTWPQTVGNTVTDGTVTWTNVGVTCTNTASDTNCAKFSVSGLAFTTVAQNWAGNTAYVLNAVIQPTSGNAGSYQFQVTVAGTSGIAAPTWPQTVGNTVTDGGVTWKNLGVAPVNWAASTAYALNATVLPTGAGNAGGYEFQATVAGTSGATAPTWPQTVGNTVTDGTVTWKNIGLGNYTTASFLGNPAFTGAQGTFSSGGTLANNYVLFTGQVYLNKGGNPGTITRDDGYELSIPGASSFDKSNPLIGTGLDSFIVTAPSAGLYNFTLSYGECCSPPAVLKSGAGVLPAQADTLYNVQVVDSGVPLTNEIGHAHVEQFGGQGGSQVQQLTRASDAYSAFYSAAGTPLPACVAAQKHVRLCATDATACTNGTTYASGGTTQCVVNCNGSNWLETGEGCY